MVNNVSRPVRAGLYGAGAFGSFVVRALAESPLVSVAAVASRTKAHAQALARAQGIGQVCDSYESLIKNHQLELIIVATPPADHAPQARAALTAGKHVLVEKPLATTLSEGQELVSQAASLGLVLAVDHPMLYTPLIEAAMLFNSSRLVGPLLRIAVENIASCEGLGDNHWFWNKDISGGILVEHGTHFFDWCSRLTGEPQVVIALASMHGQREDQVIAAVRHAPGVIASYHHAFVARPETERTRTVLSYESVDLVLDGWIPTRLHMTGHSAALATTTIRRMLNRTVESLPDPRVGFFFDSGPKDALYASAVRAAVEDTVQAIRDPSHEARNGARRVLTGLRLACAAREAAERHVAVEVGTTKSAALP